jgi:hypothetical protein
MTPKDALLKEAVAFSSNFLTVPSRKKQMIYYNQVLL